MITNKERLEKFIEQVKQLETLAEENRDRNVYPVSFFSQAFDFANKILEDLQQIELFQIKLIENQINEQQTQLLSAVHQSANSFIPEDTIPPPVQPTQPAQPVQPVQPVQPIQSVQTTQPIQSTQLAQPIQPVQEEKKVLPSYLFDQKKLIDLKKMISLNDRFLFCRELFANNENLMNQVLSELNMEESYDASIDYLQKRFSWNFEDKNVTDFIAILKKRFS